MKKVLKGLFFTARNYLFKIVFSISVIAIIGFSSVDHYGVSWDELTGILSVRQNIDLITKGKQIEGIFKYDGTIFNFAAEAFYQIQARIHSKLPTPLKASERKIKLDGGSSLREKFNSKHSLTFFVSLLAYICVAGIVGIICGWQHAWLGAVSLAFIPRFWGHSFFNFKDVPFTALFTLSSFIGAYLVEQYLQVEEKNKLKFDRLTGFSILYGVIVGLISGIRVGGIIIVLFPFITYLLVRIGISRKNVLKDASRLFIYSVLTLVSCLLVAVSCYPSSWSNPVLWFPEALTALSNYSWNGKVLFNGDLISQNLIPWYYIPTWIAITVPLIFQITFLIGLFLLLGRYARLSSLQKACIILVLLQAFFLPALIVIKHSVIYNEIRHILFILPAIAIVSSVALIWLYEVFLQRSIKIFMVSVVIIFLAQIRFDMQALHPYEYTYFNRNFGGLSKAYARYDTDYWGLSMREAMEWINLNGALKLPVIVGGPPASASVFAAPDIKITYYEEGINPQRPFYYLALPNKNTLDFQSYFSECNIAYLVRRQDTPLTSVRRCDLGSRIK